MRSLLETDWANQARFSIRRFLPSAAAPTLVLLLGAVVATTCHLREVAPYNADQAIVALMAQDILYRGAHPVFFDGSDYAGTLEQHYLAAWFRFFPDTVTVHRVAIATLLLGIVLTIWSLVLVLVGRRAAFAGAMFLALGPQFFYRRGLMSDGPYTPIFLLAALVLLLSALAHRSAESGVSARALVVSIGFLLGLAWWTHPLALALGLAVAFVLFARDLRHQLSWGVMAACLLAFFGGSLPWWLINGTAGWPSLRSSDTALRTFDQMLMQWSTLAREGVPILIGARVVGEPAPLAGWISFAGLMATGATLTAGFLVINRFGSAMARKLTLSATVLAAASAGMGLVSQRVTFVEPRFIFPMYFVLALCFGVAVTSVHIVLPLRIAMVGVTFALHLHSHLTAQPSHAPSPALVRQIEGSGVTTLYTTYWKAYPITMRSQGRLVAAPFGPNEPTRGRPERALVDASPNPAFLLEGLTAARMARLLDRHGWVSKRMELGSLTLFFNVPPAAIAEVRACGCIPVASE